MSWYLSAMDHDHEWGPLEHSRLGGIVHRKCQIVGCKVISALDDDEDDEEER